MKPARLEKIWNTLNASFWFVPGIMVLVAILLSFVMIKIDEKYDTDFFENLGWAYSLGPEGSRAVLSAIAGSMATVATTAFSITIVALQLASSQFGPRLLRNFMQDRGNQFVLGTFISTFTYCLMVLRTVNGTDEGEFVPHLAVTFGLTMAILSIAVLIYFIHHSAVSIHVDRVIARVGDALDDSLEKLFPEQIGDEKNNYANDNDMEKHAQQELKHQGLPVKVGESGYIQAIDSNNLMDLAIENDVLIRLSHQPGQHIISGAEVARIFPLSRAPESLADSVRRAVILGSQRTEQQDIEFLVSELVEIAVRALSPGMNDPFTAIRCIDRLCVVLCQLSGRKIPSRFRYDEKGHLRVIADNIQFDRILETSFNQIRQYSDSSLSTTIRLLESLKKITDFSRRQTDIIAVKRQADIIHQVAMKQNFHEYDSQEITEKYQAVIDATEQAWMRIESS